MASWSRNSCVTLGFRNRVSSLSTVVRAPIAPADILGIPAPITATDAEGAGPILEKETGKDESQPSGDSDARTLWVEYDEQGERHREWRKVVSDCVVHSWKDWPHEGPPSLQYALKQFGKIRGDPRLWLQLWLRRHHLAETDRTAHEMRTLIEAIYLGGCYDQLNLPSLAAFEAIGRRLQTITEAYAASLAVPPNGITPASSQASAPQMRSCLRSCAPGLPNGERMRFGSCSPVARRPGRRRRTHYQDLPVARQATEVGVPGRTWRRPRGHDGLCWAISYMRPQTGGIFPLPFLQAEARQHRAAAGPTN